MTYPLPLRHDYWDDTRPHAGHHEWEQGPDGAWRLIHIDHDTERIL